MIAKLRRAFRKAGKEPTYEEQRTLLKTAFACQGTGVESRIGAHCPDDKGRSDDRKLNPYPRSEEIRVDESR